MEKFMKRIVLAVALLVSLSANAVQQLYYIHSDHLNTPQALTDSNQQVIWRVEQQTPFGEVEVDEDPDGDGEDVVFNLRFPGQYFDEETNTNYNYYRTYDPSLGRYIQSDPIGLDGGINTYAYVSGNPLIYSDPYGLFQTPEPTDQSWCKLNPIACKEAFKPVKKPPTPLLCPPGGGGGSGDEGDDDEDECSPLEREIDNLTSELKKRYADLVRDDQKLPASGPHSIEGHQRQFRNKQTRLRNKLNEARTKGCWGYTPDAPLWSTRETPSPGWGGAN